MKKLGLSSIALLTVAACAPDEDLTRHDASQAVVGSAAHADAGISGATPGFGGDASHDAATSAGHDAAPLDAAHAPADSGGEAGPWPAVDAAGAHAPDASDAAASGSATPSTGCGKAGRPADGRVSVPGDHNYAFPAAYDGKRPFPLLIGFHAAMNQIDQIEGLIKGSEFEQSYVRAFPKSKGTAWDYSTDIGKVLAMYDDLLANYCIDTSRIFATGHSSGAQLIVQILTPAHKSDADHFRFRAVAPVAASRYGTVSRAIPVLYIQGAHDMVRNSDGADVVKEFVTANGCTAMTQPYPALMCTSGGKAVNDGCVAYQGCTAPTVWCSHDDPAYSNTSHGWPCFATKTMFDFFAALP